MNYEFVCVFIYYVLKGRGGVVALLPLTAAQRLQPGRWERRLPRRWAPCHRDDERIRWVGRGGRERCPSVAGATQLRTILRSAEAETVALAACFWSPAGGGVVVG